MPRTRVKICGITRPEDACLAARLGADALGLVFYPGSRRAVSVPQAQFVRAAVPVFVSVVGLFVNPTEAEVETVISQVHLDCLQFHGDEQPEFCASFGLPYMKAFRVRDDEQAFGTLMQDINSHEQACAILLDAYDAAQHGGTGKQFDWSLARRCVQQSTLPVVLAGGLSADNARKAITEVQPWALDLSSGVESKPGHKDPQKLQVFFNEVNRVSI